VKCRWCANPGNHYLGGNLWVCFTHYLKALR
jgi:hypothetical protein